MRKLTLALVALIAVVACPVLAQDTNTVANLVSAAEGVNTQMGVLITAGLALFIAIFGIMYFKRALKAGAR